MDNPKRLIYGVSNDVKLLWPRVKYEDISEKERCRLRRKCLHQVDEADFEAWLAIDLEDNKWEYDCSFTEDGEFIEEIKVLADTQSLEAHLRYVRAEYKHIKNFSKWKKEGLDPLVEDLVTMAKQDPQYDWYYLYMLERQKLICMEAYLSHSRVADEYGNYVGKRWLCLCIQLLGYILDETSISSEQLQKLNVNNSLDLLDSHQQTLLLEEELSEDEAEGGGYTQGGYYLRKLYIRKVERLYYRIRLEHTRMWWE